jgi:hypothetical protein
MTEHRTSQVLSGFSAVVALDQLRHDPSLNNNGPLKKTV